MTSGPCLWMPNPQSCSEPCSVDQLLIAKSKPPSSKERKITYKWLQNIDFDPRNPKHRKVSSIMERVLLTKRLSAVDDSKSNINLNSVGDSPSPGKPVTLPLLRKLYLKKHDSRIVANNGKCNHENNNSTGLSRIQSLGILGQKIETCIQKTTEHSPEKFLKDVTFSNEEIAHVEEVPEISGSVMIGIRTKLVLLLHQSAKMFVLGKLHWKRRMVLLLLLLQKKL